WKSHRQGPDQRQPQRGAPDAHGDHRQQVIEPRQRMHEAREEAAGDESLGMRLSAGGQAKQKQADGMASDPGEANGPWLWIKRAVHMMFEGWRCAAQNYVTRCDWSSDEQKSRISRTEIPPLPERMGRHTTARMYTPCTRNGALIWRVGNRSADGLTCVKNSRPRQLSEHGLTVHTEDLDSRRLEKWIAGK